MRADSSRKYHAMRSRKTGGTMTRSLPQFSDDAIAYFEAHERGEVYLCRAIKEERGYLIQRAPAGAQGGTNE